MKLNIETMEKVKIGEMYVFRDFTTRKYGVKKVVDGKEGMFFEHVYNDYYFIIRDTDENKAVLDGEIEVDKWYYMHVLTSLPPTEISGWGRVYQIAFPGECLLDKEKFKKYVGNKGLCIGNCVNATYAQHPDLWLDPHSYKDFDELAKNAIRCEKDIEEPIEK